MMIDARADDDESEQEAPTKSVLTNKEIVSLSVGFLLAGYDTTANTLGYVAYLLAINPDKQDILIREIDDYLAQNKVRLPESSKFLSSKNSVKMLEITWTLISW